MRVIKLLLSIIFIISFISCTTYCPSFNEEILNWIPYQEKDVIELYSQPNDSTLKFSIRNVTVTHKTSYKFGTKCGTCVDDIYINDDDSNFNVTIYFDKKGIGSQDYKIYDTYFATYNSKHTEEKNYQFEDTEYDMVWVFEKTDSNGTFKKLIIAKEFGVIGLIDIHDNTWSLKTNVESKGLNQQRNIVVNNVSCG